VTLAEFQTAWKLKYTDPNTLGPMGYYATGNSQYIQVTCPFCVRRFRDRTPDRGHHLNVHYEKEWFKCLRCNSRGPLESLIGKQRLKETPKSGVYIFDPNKVVSTRPKTVDLSGSSCKPGNVIAPLTSIPKHHPAWEYLVSEGFTRPQITELASIYGIYVCLHGKAFCGDSGNTTTNRLIFQIQEGKKILGWQARWLPTQWPPSEEDKAASKLFQKYLISPGLRKEYLLYNWDLAQEWDTWVIVEGIKKVWKTGPYAMANFGVGSNGVPPEGLPRDAYSKFWTVRLANSKRRVVFLYDKGAENQAEEHVKNVNELGGNASAAFLPEDGADDLDDYQTPEIRRVILDHLGYLPKKIKPEQLVIQPRNSENKSNSEQP